MLPATHVTRHFTWSECVTTRAPELQDTPDPEARSNARIFAVAVLEVIRAAVGVPVSISSWYRSAALNAHVGGTPLSLHRQALAADLRTRLGRQATWLRIVDLVQTGGMLVTSAIVYADKPHVHVDYRWWTPHLEPRLYLSQGGRLTRWTGAEAQLALVE